MAEWIKKVWPSAPDNLVKGYDQKDGTCATVEFLISRGLEADMAALNNANYWRLRAVASALIDRIAPAELTQHAVAEAAGNGWIDHVSRLLSLDPPAPVGARAARNASEHRHRAVVELLMALTPPAPISKYTIRNSAKHGWCDIVKRILDAEHVDPSVKTDRHVAEIAASKGHMDVVIAFLTHRPPEPE